MDYHGTGSWQKTSWKKQPEWRATFDSITDIIIIQIKKTDNEGK